jgi:3-oxoacyl-[acyl-carrier protein] reductase
VSVEGKVAIVTGGASGMGRASALLLARNGAKLVVADRDAAGARSAAAEIVAAGGSAIDVAGDIGDSGDVASLVSRTLQQHGRIDVLFHAAGICPRVPFLEMTDAQWRDVLRVNLDGTFFITRDVGRVMAAQNAGTMILVASDRGVHGSIDYAHYAASKGGMLALTKSLALTLGKHHVTVNAINPGITDTPLARAAVVQWEQKMALDVLGTYSTPEQIAGMVLFLAGTAGAFMTGQVLGTRMRYGA